MRTVIVLAIGIALGSGGMSLLSDSGAVQKAEHVAHAECTSVCPSLELDSPVSDVDQLSIPLINEIN